MNNNIARHDANVNKDSNTKRIFLPTFLHILKEVRGEKPISFSSAKAIIAKKEKVYQRYLKICWAVEKLNKAYFESSKTKRYSTSDVFRMTNFMLENSNVKTISERQFFRDAKFLEEANLIKRMCFHLGKENGSVSFFKQNKILWDKRFYVLQHVIQNDIKEFFKDKNIVGDVASFEKQIENAEFKKSRMSDVEMAVVIDKSIKDNIKIKNSRKSSFKNFVKIKEETIKQIRELSSNEATFKNCLWNLRDAILDFSSEYEEEAITKFYLTKLRNGYNKKIWFLRKKNSSLYETDYNNVWGAFKDKISNKFKKNGLTKTQYELVDFGDGITRRLDANGVAHQIGGITDPKNYKWRPQNEI